MLERPPVLGDRALARLQTEVALGCRRQRDAGVLRLLGFHLEQRCCQFSLRVVLRPLRLVATDLPTADLSREAPGLALRALARDSPGALIHLRHLVILLISVRESERP